MTEFPVKKAAPRKRTPAKKAVPRKKTPAKKVAPRKRVPVPKNPAEEAWMHHLKGFTWEQVAKKTGYNNGNEAYMAAKAWVGRAAAAADPERRRMALEISLARYEVLVQANLAKALKGDQNAATTVLRAQTRIDSLHRLGESDSTTGVRTIVVAGSPEEYAAKLREVVQQRERDRRGGTIIDAEVVEEGLDPQPEFPPELPPGAAG